MRDGKAVRLSSQECAILVYLVKINPRPVKHKELLDHVHSSYGSLYVRISNLRKKLKRLGINITNTSKEGGFMLIETSEIRASAAGLATV